MQARTAGCLLLLAWGPAGLGCQALRSEGSPRRTKAAAPVSSAAAAPAQPSAANEDRYRIVLRRGDFLHVRAEQQGLDVTLRLTDATEREILTLDSPVGAWGPETLDFVAGSAGAYLLAVRKPAARGPRPTALSLPAAGVTAGGAGFTLTIAAPRPARPADVRRAEACLEVSLGDADWRQGGAAGAEGALRRYERAASVWRSLGDGHAEAVAEIRIGRAWESLGKTRQAVTHWKQALAWFRGDRREAPPAALYNRLGGGNMDLGRFASARSLFAAAAAEARRRGERYEEVAALNNLGLLAERAGKPWAALALLEQARAGWPALGDRRGEGTTLQNLGQLYTMLGRLADAEDALKASQADLLAAGAAGAEGITSMDLGWARFLGGDAAAGLAALSHARDLELSAGDRHREAIVRQRLGMLYRDTGDLPRAIDELHQSLALLGPSDDRQTKAQTESHLGAALTAAGDPRAGLRLQDSALVLLRRLDDPRTEAYAHFRRAQAEQALGSLDAARADMEIGLARIEVIRGLAESQDLRMSYLDSVHDQYERLIDVLMELDARKPGAGFDRAAVAAAENGRARSLLDIVADTGERGRGAAQEAAAARLREVDRSIDAAMAQGRIAAAQAAADTAPIAGPTGLRDLLAKRQEILVQLSSPADGAAARPPRILGAEEIRNEILDADTVLLLYALGEHHSYLFVLGRDGQQSVTLPPRPEIAAAVRQLNGLLAGDRAGHNANQERLTAKAVSDLLLAPAARFITRRRIAVVADDILADLPFGVLPAPGGDGAPLLATHEIVVVPSASVLAAIRRRAKGRLAAPRLLAVLADPLLPAPQTQPTGAATAVGAVGAVGAGGEPAATRAAHDLSLLKLPPLPWSRQEAAAILALAPLGQGMSAVGADASIDLAQSGALALYRLLHFATHALVDLGAADLSGIVLTGTGADGRRGPGFLHSYEIADLRLPADLVVLSTCNSGRGQALRGEGLLGLTQSFFTAGASRVIVSLWNVDDSATADLMQRFYRELLAGRRSPADALRVAQLALRDDPRWASPYYWAGFELQGDWRPLR
jgi:CHAT domain-containing protein